MAQPKDYTEMDIFRLIVKKRIEAKGNKVLMAKDIVTWLELTENLYNQMQVAKNESINNIEKQIEQLV